MNQNLKISVIGWILAIVTSVGSSWGTFRSNVYKMESETDIHSIQISDIQDAQKEQDCKYEEFRETLNRIDKNVTEINGKLELKEDKKWIK